MKNMALGTVAACLLLALLSGCARSKFNGPLFTDHKELGSSREFRMYPVIADMNYDGVPDLVATHRRPLSENSLRIFLGGQEQSYSELVQNWSSPGYSALGIGDVNNDGKNDLVAASHFNKFHTYLSFDGNTFQKEIINASHDGYIRAQLVDLEGDGSVEAVLLGNERAGVQIFDWDGDRGWRLRATLMDGRIGRDMKIVDMNRDGRLDIVVSYFRDGVIIFLQEAGGGWTVAPPTNFYSENGDFRSLVVADFNRDGNNDIALNGSFSGVLKPSGPDVYLSDGKGGWISDSEGLKVFKRPADGITAGDLNGDGVPEILAGGNITNKMDQNAYGLFAFARTPEGRWELID
ncbi:MAG: hypothetical protein DCC75_13855, partial [Proteobacteria bacterium]